MDQPARFYKDMLTEGKTPIQAYTETVKKFEEPLFRGYKFGKDGRWEVDEDPGSRSIPRIVTCPSGDETSFEASNFESLLRFFFLLCFLPF